MGWRAGNIVLGYHPGTCTQGGGPGLADATSYHVVSATSAARTATIGKDSGPSCGLLGLPARAGVPCGTYDANKTQVLSWTGSAGATFAAGLEPGGLAPSGTTYAGADTTNTTSQTIIKVITVGGSTFTVAGTILSVMWIDDNHFFVGAQTGASQVYSTGTQKASPVSAAGQPLARIPASLD